MRTRASIVLIALGAAALVFGLLSYEAPSSGSIYDQVYGSSTTISYGLQAKATAAAGAMMLAVGLLLRRRAA